jgi:hypothetical protein
MPLRRVALVRTDVSEERSASIIRVTLGELGTTSVVTGNRRRLLASSSVVERDTLHLYDIVQLCWHRKRLSPSLVWAWCPLFGFLNTRIHDQLETESVKKNVIRWDIIQGGSSKNRR